MSAYWRAVGAAIKGFLTLKPAKKDEEPEARPRRGFGMPMSFAFYSGSTSDATVDTFQDASLYGQSQHGEPTTAVDHSAAETPKVRLPKK